MRHLTNAQIQAVADNEASQPDRDHADACDLCGAQVEQRRDTANSFARTLEQIEIPPSTRRRVEQTLRGSSAAGATRLRHEPQRPWRPAAWGTAGIAAATVLAIVFVAPMIKTGRGAVSAAEILAESANRLAQPLSGVELLVYELVLDGVPKEMMPDHTNGTYRVSQVIDHTTPGRFKFATHGPDGQPITAIAQDPASGRRVMMLNVEGQAYRFEVAVPDATRPSLPEIERLHMEASITMMQASGKQLLEVVQTPDGQQYRIEVPKVSVPGTNPVWDLTEARVTIDASDYRVRELEVKGTFLKQAYSVSYRLISRVVAGSVLPETFEVPRQPGEILISGEGSALPARDAIVLALRELARLKSGR